MQRWIVAEQGVVVGSGFRDGLDASLTEHKRAIYQPVAAILALELVAQQRLLVIIDLAVGLAETLLRPQVQPGEQFAVQPVGGPVGRLVGTVAPDRAHLHAADTLPGGLAVEDVVGAKQRGAIDALHLFGDRWCLAIDLATEPAQQAERHAEDAYQRPP
ncbi:hypothetical protein D3C73_945000 [compost metagenome]